LWERYSQRADQHIESLPPEHTRTLRYETFLTEPLPMLEDLCGFIGLNASASDLQAAAATIDTSRGSAYQRDPDLVQFFKTVKNSPQMVKYGYT
jgi:hypothetical protein